MVKDPLGGGGALPPKNLVHSQGLFLSPQYCNSGQLLVIQRLSPFCAGF